jgi:hypothetical protein
MTRKTYLVIFAALVVAIALSGVYVRQRARATAAAAAACDNPAPPPSPTTPPPKLPGFQIEPACGNEPAKPASVPDAKKR